MTVYLVTGVNRGIGLAFVELLSQDNSNTVIGTVRSLRNASKVLDLKRSNVHLIELDFLADIETFKTAFKTIDDIASGIDVVIHNAGALGAYNFVSVMEYKAEDYIFPFEVNVVGSIKLYQTISPYLYRGEGHKVFAFVSSLAGKITNSDTIFNGYGASKAALNFFMRQAHLENKHSDNKIQKESTIYCIHPGFVDTDMAQGAIELGGDMVEKFSAILSPTESAARIIGTLYSAESGTFVHNDGTVLDF